MGDSLWGRPFDFLISVFGASGFGFGRDLGLDLKVPNHP